MHGLCQQALFRVTKTAATARFAALLVLSTASYGNQQPLEISVPAHVPQVLRCTGA